MSDPLPSREDSLLAAANAANALLWLEYQRAQADLKMVRGESRNLARDIERARKDLEQQRKHPFRLLFRKVRREITRPFRRREPVEAGTAPAPPEKTRKPSKAERRVQAWQDWIGLPESARARSAALTWEIPANLCQALMEECEEGERFLFAGCTAPSLALALLLEEKGCPATVMGAPAYVRKLGREGLRLETDPLAERLRYESEFTSSFEHLVVHAGFLDEVETLPRLRLWPAQHLWVLDPTGADVPPTTAPSETPSQRVPGLFHWNHAPRALLHPDWKFRQPRDTASWPSPPEARTRYGNTLPSGRPWPRITIVTVTRNQGHYLRQTLDSVLAQEYPNLEYIVLDGASTDDSPRILEEYQPRLAHAASEPDGGQADALNRAFARSTGEIMAWLNSDDRYLPGALRRVALAFDAHPDADIVAGGCALVRDDSDQPYHIHHCRFPENACAPLPLARVLDLDGAWFKGDFFMQPEVFWRRRIWERAGAGLDATLHYNMDYELFARFAAAGAAVFHARESLCLFRMHAAQKTHGDKPFIPEARQVRDRLAARFLTASPAGPSCAS